MRVLSDEVDVCAPVREGAKTQGEGGLCRLVHRPVVGVQEGDAHFIECRVIARRANEAEVSEVLQSELGLIGLRYKPSIVERTKQLRIRYIQVALGTAEGEGEESKTQEDERLHPSPDSLHPSAYLYIRLRMWIMSLCKHCFAHEDFYPRYIGHTAACRGSLDQGWYAIKVYIL